MFTGVTLPFSVADLVSAAMDLLTLVGPFVLIGLAFMLAPKFFRLVRAAFGGSGRNA